MAQDHPKDRIIVSLDVTNAGEALKLVEGLAPHVGSFKIGLEFITSSLARLMSLDANSAATELKQLQKLYSIIGEQLFWDGKFKDIPNTVAGASRPLSRSGIRYFNVHCLGGSEMMKRASLAAKEHMPFTPNGRRVQVLGVTILTSLSYGDLLEMNIDLYVAVNAPHTDNVMPNLVSHLALLAKDCGLDGVVCSPQEITAVRAACGPDFKIVTPGIRDKESPPDDQKRTMTAAEAISAGADELVIGRLITAHKNPVEATKQIANEIGEALAKKVSS
jgi:orotidine-5'-phosphate decarboxylase